FVFHLAVADRYYCDMDAVRKYQPAQAGVGISSNGQPANWKGSSFSKGKTAVHQLGRAQSDESRDRSFQWSRNGIGGHLDATEGGSRNFRNTDLWFESLERPYGLVSVGSEIVGINVNPKGYKESHFATFPPMLIEPFIEMGSSVHGQCSKCG